MYYFYFIHNFVYFYLFNKILIYLFIAVHNGKIAACLNSDIQQYISANKV